MDDMLVNEAAVMGTVHHVERCVSEHLLAYAIYLWFPVVLRRTKSPLDVVNCVVCLLYVGMDQTARCHGTRSPPNPEFTLKPKKKKPNHQSECTRVFLPFLPRTCCQHLEAERMKVCSNITLFSCDNLCWNPLPCGNHYRTKTRLALKSQSAKSLAQHNGQPFEECHLPCEKLCRKLPNCMYLFAETCHPGQCSPSDKYSRKVTVRFQCQN
ncbi:NF-X1-type zinc finger protein NFXL2-like [Hevea brasiliensis]|uniref:NF-X1-type zinc finger protein NFXL2-like n=1 Tax=Hevea brasiliensis TaxID=3981 RepID=UPI0025DA2002|nr:NF-X1-type zinc finger protein NFXL2-like [Hevea brasiliensis]